MLSEGQGPLNAIPSLASPSRLKTEDQMIKYQRACCILRLLKTGQAPQHSLETLIA